MAVVKGSKICIGMLNMRSPGSSSNKAYKKLDFMASPEVKNIYLMKNEIVHETYFNRF